MLKLLHELKAGEVFRMREEAGAVRYIRGEYSEEHHAYRCAEEANGKVIFFAPGELEIFN